MSSRITIVGQGLAGTCLAWRLWDRGRDIKVVDRGGSRGSSWASAGLVSPVTGKGMNPSWQVGSYLREAEHFYKSVEMVLSERFFTKVPVLRLFRNAAEREKFEAKRAELEPWIEEVLDRVDPSLKAAAGGVVWKGSGWLDTRRFLNASKGYFRERGFYEERQVDLEKEEGRTVACIGAAGLGDGPFGFLPERRAKGEILIVRIPGLTEERVISRGGWLIPLGANLYRAGATYEWDDLTDTITLEGRATIEKLVKTFTDLPYEVVEHTAGVRPIIRRSQPVIGPHPEWENLYFFNGLGSKGVLYAPGVADRLAAHLGDGREIDPDLSLSAFAGA